LSEGERPSVAICIPAYNQARYLRRAVESAWAQEYGGPLEVWVADDASTDETGEVVDALEREDERLRAIRQPRNLGLAGNVSSLMRSPRTEYLVRLDCDDELEPAFVPRLIELMVGNPDAGYGHSGVVELDRDGRIGERRQLARSTGFQPADEALRASLSGYRTVANILIFRRQAMERLDFYDGRPESAEDYDLAVRMADAGYGNVYVDEPLARYRVWEDEGGARSRRKALQLEGYLRIFSESMEPAWERRGWDTGQVRRQRQWLAVHHCAHCFGSQYSAEERRRLIGLLRELGDGPRLRLRIRLCEAGLGPTLETASHLRGRVKSRLKAAVKYAFGRIRSNG
jgi:glycosyltransferase involved in cell wall biosynthesis